MRLGMAKVGTRIGERGTFAREGGRLLFRRELGRRWHIDGLAKDRLSLGHPGRSVGTVIDASTVAIERFTPKFSALHISTERTDIPLDCAANPSIADSRRHSRQGGQEPPTG